MVPQSWLSGLRTSPVAQGYVLKTAMSKDRKELFLNFNFIGPTLMNKLCRFQAHSSITHHLYMALCPSPPSQTSSVTIYLTPFILFYFPPALLPSGNHHTVVCAYEILHVCLVCSFVAFSFICHICVKSYGC